MKTDVPGAVGAGRHGRLYRTQSRDTDLDAERFLLDRACTPGEVTSDPIDVLLDLVSILEDLELPYAVGGSIASTVYGEPRRVLRIPPTPH